MGYFLQDNIVKAEAMALDLRARYPKDDNVLETLTQIYLGTGRLTNALASIEEQLALDPQNARALLNQAAVCIQLKDYARAIPPLDTLLKTQPENSAALMNRAIAHLQGGQLEAAGQDYEALRKLMPEYHAVYYGLGEVAFRRQDNAAAIKHYETYLKYGDSASEEYQGVAKRVRELKSGGR
jgi:tetratricopeptide (TPR) repeat protein